ncbi:hypothetical protein I302_101816 [Kwoniella bestiolae CBS 10118]|uniref:Uncharacterized protein n=1 Tax=Kwoniella bestiolae CBS 10118 TaxID=1296100 RepID=A0A1B9GDB4_9TREE|nr:hypothetical protein I302_00496 [Kwoniella bestiolae CBS 10118]OCF29005.1 hypothetical protein I302_00496 [Kwoniella bestiolae CBS 10118]
MPSTTSKDKHQIPPHPDRPFSPSPPRENRHSASRPPSLLFGAPPVGTVASSSSFSIEGLPTTPKSHHMLNRSTSHEHIDDLGFFDHSSSPVRRKRHESEPAAQGQTTRGRPISVHSSAQRSDSESSTTSSASPPLGATSILSTIATSTPPKGSKPPTKSPVVYQGHVRTSSDVTNLRTPTLDALGSPKSFQSGFSSSSSGYDNLSFSKSVPRLHQPTVVRRTSGRGLAFLPPPAQALSHSTTVHHQTPSPLANIVHEGERTPSMVSLKHIQRHANVLDLGQPLGHAAQGNNDDQLISMKGSDDRPANRPTSYSEIPLPPTPPGEEQVLHEVAEGTIGGVLFPPHTEAPISRLEIEEDELIHPLLTSDVSDLSETGSTDTVSSEDHDADQSGVTTSSNDPIDHDVFRITTPDIAERAAHGSVSSAENAAGSVKDAIASSDMESEAGESVVENMESERSTGITEDHHHPRETQRSIETQQPPLVDLNETSPTPTTIPPEIEHLPLPTLPYKPRAGSRTYRPSETSSTPDTDNTRQISLYATLNHPSDPLPQLTAYRLELALSWGDAQIFRWIPGRRYIPDWNLKVVGANVVFDVRAVVKSVVSRIPIFWRFASWL